MTKEAIIERTLKTLGGLPADKVEEVADFADFVLKNMKNRFCKKGYIKWPKKAKALTF
jgi:hypothetical protein